MIEMSLQEDHSPRLTGWRRAWIADGRSSRRAVYRRGVAILALLLTLSIGVPSTAGAQVPTVTSTRHERVRTPGEYAIVVSIPPVAVAQSITVSAGNQVQRNVQIGPSTVHLAFHVNVPHRSYSVLATSKGTPVHFTVAEALQQSPSGATGPSGTTGQTGATGASSPTGVVDIGPPNGPYSTLVWSDEFNGPSGSPPNPVNWTADDYGACGTGTLSTPTQDLANGSLNGAGDLAISALAGPAGGYSSASLDSYGKFSFEYGRLAARIEEPAGVGLCAQFWLLGNSATLGPDCWPNCGEIDVHEALGNFPLQADAFLHGPVPNQPGYQQWGSSIDSALPLTSGFHTYGITWRPNKITWTLDGVPWVTATPRSLTTGSTWAFNGNPFHIILDLAVGGWPGPPNASTKFPATMLVDWIRLYQ
jgi:beta-glucanase (GH16 family)